jgi:hypothetical protein
MQTHNPSGLRPLNMHSKILLELKDECARRVLDSGKDETDEYTASMVTAPQDVSCAEQLEDTALHSPGMFTEQVLV